jgi:phosphoribosylamine--glycine ligase
VKADGLAGGKGAIVCATLTEADDAVAACLERRAFGEAGRTVVIEEFLRGEEASFFVLASGRDVVPLAAAQDHKTVFDGDHGPNTGGMGAYSPVPRLTAALHEEIMARIARPTIAALAEEGAPYRGVLFIGLMLTADGPKVIEFNCRFGDPECQAIMVRAADDLVPLFRASAAGDRLPARVSFTPDAAVCVTMASGGYPGAYRTGLDISGVDEATLKPGVHIFHAGTARRGGRLVTAGGRVLGVTALAPDLAAAVDTAYEAVRRVDFEGMHYRTDIGRRPRLRADGAGGG